MHLTYKWTILKNIYSEVIIIRSNKTWLNWFGYIVYYANNYKNMDMKMIICIILKNIYQHCYKTFLYVYITLFEKLQFKKIWK